MKKTDRLKEAIEYQQDTVLRKMSGGKNKISGEIKVKLGEGFDNQFKAKMKKLKKRRAKNKSARKSRRAQHKRSNK